jgi:hypothetical protein
MIEAPARVPVETTSPLKASEMLRAGILNIPTQTFCEEYEEDGTGRVTGACAVGTMWYWRGTMDPLPPPERVALDVIYAKTAEAPCGHAYAGGELYEVIIHLNDNDEWHRSRIATWMEGLGL